MLDPAPQTSGNFWLRRILVGTTLLAAATLSFLYYIGKLTNNLREVSPGKVYRSAQMQPEGFQSVIAEKNLKSIVNLRGKKESSSWYAGELAVCKAANIDHADINIGLGELPRPEALKQLIEKLEAGPYPMLMHCRQGADRSSLGAVFYAHLVEKKPLAQAEAEQLNWHYGHFPIGPAQSIDAFFALYHKTANGQSLKDWVLTTYPNIYAQENKPGKSVD